MICERESERIRGMRYLENIIEKINSKNNQLKIIDSSIHPLLHVEKIHQDKKIFYLFFPKKKFRRLV